MKLSNIMLYWQNNYQLGMTLCVLLVIGLYVGVSTWILLSVRKRGYDICTSAYIPVINIFVRIKYGIKYRMKLRRKRKEELARQKEAEELNDVDLDEELDIF